MNKSFSSPLHTNKDNILEYILLIANDYDRKSWKNRFMISLCIKQNREQTTEEVSVTLYVSIESVET